MVDQNHRRVAGRLDVADCDLETQSLVRAVAELLHEAARLGAVLRDVGPIARQALEHLRGHTPDALRGWQHCAADIALDRKSTRLNSSHVSISYAVFCLKKKNKI